MVDLPAPESPGQPDDATDMAVAQLRADAAVTLPWLQ